MTHQFWNPARNSEESYKDYCSRRKKQKQVLKTPQYFYALQHRTNSAGKLVGIPYIKEKD